MIDSAFKPAQQQQQQLLSRTTSIGEDPNGTQKASAAQNKPKKFSPFSVDSLLSQKESSESDQLILHHNNNNQSHEERVKSEDPDDDERIKIDVCGDESDCDEDDDLSDDADAAKPHVISHPQAQHHPRFLASLLHNPGAGPPPPGVFPPGHLGLPLGSAWLPQFRSPPLSHHTGSE